MCFSDTLANFCSTNQRTMKFLQVVNSNCYFQEVNLNNRVLHHPTGCVPNSFEHVFNPDATAAAEESFWGFSCCASHKGRPDAELAEGRWRTE